PVGAWRSGSMPCSPREGVHECATARARARASVSPACGFGSLGAESMSRGRFIALEGIDGSGTTSQAEALAARLRARGHRVSTTHEPSTGSIGRLVRERLGGAASPLDPAAMALLFAADRMD